MKRSGMSLAEVLVVYALIGTLIGIGLPTIGSVRQYAQTTMCKGNLKSLAVAMAVYEQDNSRFAPMFTVKKYYDINPRFGPANQLRQAIGEYWFDKIKTKAFCPSRKVNQDQKQNAATANYGLNASLCGWEKPLSTVMLKNPGRVFLAADSGYAGISWQNLLPGSGPEFLENAYVPGLAPANLTLLRSDTRIDAKTGRHKGTSVNTVLADLHIEKIPAADYSLGPQQSPSLLWTAK